MLALHAFVTLLPAMALAAPLTTNTNERRQKTDGCTPTFTDGVRYSIQSAAEPSLWWNATFPTRDYVKAFTDVKLANRINGDESSVSQWQLFSDEGHGPYKISSTVPKDSPWYLAYHSIGEKVDGAGSDATDINQISVGCTIDEDNPDVCLKGCSLTTWTSLSDDYTHCLGFDISKGGLVKVGDAVRGPYDCANLVNFVQIS